MAFTTDPVAFWNAASGVLLLALAAFVLWLRPRRRATLALGVFSAAFGVQFVVLNLVTPDDPLVPVLFPFLVAMRVLAIAGIVGIALWVPRPLPRARRRLLLLPVAGFVAYVAAIVLALATMPEGFVVDDPVASAFPGLATAAYLDAHVLFYLQPAALLFAGLLLVERWRAAEGRDREAMRPTLALLAAALALYPAVLAGSDVMSPFLRGWFPGFEVAAVLALAALWLRAGAGAEGRDARHARDVALLVLAAVVASMIVGLWLPFDGPQYGVARTLGVLLLAYAILRRQLLGIDVKVKWTIRQSTIAAAFVGVFFVVSESAAAAFSETVGPYVGIAAAGLLVFALAPLQGVAQRIADTALPGARPVAEMGPDERLRVYRDQATLAWADGRLEESERALLDGLRASLGIRAEDALRAEREAMQGPRAKGRRS